MGSDCVILLGEPVRGNDINTSEDFLRQAGRLGAQFVVLECESGEGAEIYAFRQFISLPLLQQARRGQDVVAYVIKLMTMELRGICSDGDIRWRWQLGSFEMEDA